MMPLSLTIKSDESIALSGDLTFATIHKKTVQLIDFKKMNQNFVIDLAEITNSDSAGLALIIEWLKISRSANKLCKFNNLPAQLVTLANLSGFEIAPYVSGNL